MTEPKTTYTRAEIRTVREAFRDWKFGPRSIEPDGRVTVLYDQRPTEQSIGFVCQHEHGWLLVKDADDLRSQAKRGVPGAWRVLVHSLDGSEVLVVPTEWELERGGFRVTVDDEPAEEEGLKDGEYEATEADEQIDRGIDSLHRPTVDGLSAARAQAHFTASIAISLRELLALYRKYEPENMEVIVDPGPDEDQEKRAAADVPVDRLDGPVADEVFPWAR